MKYKTLFRLALKLLGVYLVIDAAVALAQYVAMGVMMFSLKAYGLDDVATAAIAAVFQVSVGLYFFFRGEWIVNLAIPSNRPYCPECAYDLSGNSGERCPECGTLVDMAKLAPPGVDTD